MVAKPELGSFRLVPQFTLITTVIVIVLIAFTAAVYLRRIFEKKSDVPFYQWDTAVAGSPRKRWMFDSLNLLREGYSKV